MSNNPNIVLFFTDDQRFDTIAALGNSAIRTPNIDKLVERGCAFTHAHIPSGTTGAVCMPSRAMLNTGRTLYHLDGSGQTIPDDHTMLGEMLQANGYRTFGTGKWHNGKETFNRSFTDGDEIFFGGMADHWNVPAYHYDSTGEYSSLLPYCIDAFHSKEVWHHQADHIAPGLHSSEMVCNAAINFINSQDGSVPFYTYISFLAPHDPRVMPEEFQSMYDPAGVEMPDNFMGGHPFPNGDLCGRDEKLAAFPRNPREVKEHIADYMAMISHLDSELGRVIAALDQKGILDDTIVVFAGDNGLALGQHGLMGKQSCYEHSNRVPLIFAGPGIPQGVQSDAYVYLLDIYPTLCELIGAERPESVEGLSMANAMVDQTDKVRDRLFIGYREFQRAIKDRRYKLVEYYADGQRNTQLFDLASDPNELANLASDPAYGERVDALRCDLIAWAKDWDDFDSEWGKVFWPHMEFC